MKLIKFNIEEYEECFISLSYMFSNKEARIKYIELLLDYKIEYPNDELDILSNIITSCKEDDPLSNINLLSKLRKCSKYNQVMEYAGFPSMSEVYYKSFIDRIKGNIDKLNNIQLISYYDSKEAFLSYIGGNFKALINSNDEYKFALWNGKSWNKLTNEEGKSIYGEFIKECKFELKLQEHIVEDKEYSKLYQKISKWNNSNRVNEALLNISRDKNYFINVKYHEQDPLIICTKNGKIINLNNGEIREANRNDLVLNTSKYNLIDKLIANSFMGQILDTYRYVLKDNDRLNFILDLISYKMLGKNLQNAIFFIGNGSTGKSTFKNIIKDLFEEKVVNVPYSYYTTQHKGNDDKSRDDILVSLNSKSWGLSSEPEEEQVIHQSRFKTILSNSTETARATRSNLIEVDLTRLDLLIDTNNIPKFSNFDDAVERRLLFVKFVNKIPENKKNSNFYREVLKPNMDCIFSYFIYRAIDMINKDLEIPKVILNDTKENLKCIDPIAILTSEFIAPLEGGKVDYSEVEAALAKICEDEGMDNPISSDKKEGYRCTILLNRIKAYRGFENIEKDRSSNGRYDKKYIIKGIAFLENINPKDIFTEEKKVFV